MRHFLLVYDVAKSELRVPVREFARADRAVAAYEELEREHYGDESVQIVLLGAESIETVRVTHGNYFEDDSAQGLVDELLGNGASRR